MRLTLSVREALEVLRAPFRSGAELGVRARTAVICAGLVALDIALSILFGDLFDSREPQQRVQWELAGYAARLVFALVGIVLLTRIGRVESTAFGFRGTAREDAVWTLRVVLTGGIAVTALAAAGVAVLLASGWDLPPPPVEAPGMLDGPWTGERVRLLMGLGILALVAAPVTEELVYRSLLLPALLSFLPAWTGILAGAAIFAWLHVSPYGHGGIGAVPFAGGLLTGWAFVARRSWLAAVIVHAAGNAWLASAVLAQSWLQEAR